jgi:hypothetical protein
VTAVLEPLDLPSAPPVTRAVAAPLRRRRAPAVALVVLGAVLVVGPIVGGLFAKVAAGKQMIDAFEPHLEADALARYRTDLDVLRAGTDGVDAVYAQQAVPAGRFHGLDEYRASSGAIDRRASGLLDRITAAVPDYRDVADIGGFDRVPFLIVLAGAACAYGGIAALGAGRGRARASLALVMVVGLGVAAYPLISNLPSGSRSGERLLDSLRPVMQPGEVRQLQDDFVLMVQGVGQLDTSFRSVPRDPRAGAQIDALVAGWPKVSSDFATLVGTINDDLDNYRDLDDIDGISRGLGVSGMAALPWMLIGVGGTGVGLAAAAWPRRAKEAR